MTEGLPDAMLGIRVVGAGDRGAQRHRVQGVGGEGALHALHRRGVHVNGRRWNKPTALGEMLIYSMQNKASSRTIVCTKPTA